MAWHLLAQIEVVFTLCCCAFGLIKGGPAERIGAILIVVSYVVGDIAFAFAKPNFPTSAIFGIDFLLAVSLLAVAIRYNSLWLGCAMVLQSVDLCSQGLSFSGDGLGVQDELWLNNGVSVLMLSCVVAGSAASWRQRVRSRNAQNARNALPSPAPFSASVL
jgi:hypothetical protein